MNANQGVIARDVIDRFFLFLSFVFVVQLTHLVFFVEFDTNNLIVLFFMYYFLFLLLLGYKVSVRKGVFLPSFNLGFVFCILLLGFFGKLISRYDYINAWLIGGLRFARESEGTGGGGWYSYLSVLFYPAALLLPFCTKKYKRKYKISLFLVATVCIIDFIFVGTRSAPIFVLLFFFMISAPPFKKIKKRYFIFIFFLLIVIFNYSTSSRIGEGFVWSEHLSHTVSTQVVVIKDDLFVFFDSYFNFGYPLIFFSHYLSHSIGEFAFLLMSDEFKQFPLPAYVMADLCVTGFCDKSYYEDVITAYNPRVGVYQTGLAALYFDFGYIGMIVISLFVPLSGLLLARLRSKPPVVSFIILYIFILFPIENFVVGGLGLVQLLLLLILVFIANIYSFFLKSLNRGS